MKLTTAEQMELGMHGNPANRLGNTRRRKSPQAGWWFTKMRQIVEMATTARENGMQVRPEQTYMNLGRGA